MAYTTGPILAIPEKPRVNWVLPSGLMTPARSSGRYPERISAPSVVDYGYSGSVLPDGIGAPRPAWHGAQASIGANLRWLVCRELCVR